MGPIAAVLLLVAGSGFAAGLPKPKLIYTGIERYVVEGSTFTRYTLSVLNRSEFAEELFAQSPDLPPCGRNANAARAWVDIYAGDGKRLNGFCALSSSSGLGTLWFSLPAKEKPPASAYIIIDDRKLGLKSKSAAVVTGKK